jgi:pantetheine-phosphate adenylyltransferase
LHVGHEALLTTAFRAGRSVAIGVTTERFLAEHPKPDAARIQPYVRRRRTLLRWLGARYPRSRWTIVPLENPFGGSVEDGVDALIVSADTDRGARAVNVERRRLGRTSIPIRTVPLVLADDLRPVSSRRIRAGEVDRRGRRKSPIRIGLAVEEVRDRRAVINGVRRAFSRARIVPVPYPPGSAPQDLRMKVAGSVAARAGELGIAIAGSGRGPRSLIEQVGAIALEPRKLSYRSPGALASALARELARSAGPKPFSSRRG